MTATSKWLSKAIGVAFLYRAIPTSVGLTLCVGVIFSIASCVLLWNGEQERRHSQLQQQADNLAIALQHNIERNFNILLSIRDLYAASKEVERQEFQIFVQNALARHSSFQVIGWAPRVSATERPFYETSSKVSAGVRTLQILEQTPSGIWARAKQRPEYFPLTYIQPADTPLLTLGLDLASFVTPKSALDKAAKTGQLVGTEPINLDSDRRGYLIFIPIYPNKDAYNTPEQLRNFASVAGENLKGVVTGIFQVADVVKASLAGLDLANINFCLYDQSSETSNQLLAFYESNSQQVSAQKARSARCSLSSVSNTVAKEEALSDRLIKSTQNSASSIQPSDPMNGVSNPENFLRTVKVGNRQWYIQVLPTPEYTAKQQQWRAGTALLSWLVCVGIPMTTVAIHRRRTSRIKLLVQNLSHANTELSEGHAEITLLNQLSDLLQACLTVDEAYIVLPPLLQHLFPEESGSVFVISPSKSLVEAVVSWGNTGTHHKMFAPDECLALRRGQAYRVADTGCGLLCQHIHGDPHPPSEYICVPMVAHGEILGVLYVGGNNSWSSQGKQTQSSEKQPLKDRENLIEEKHRLAVMVARQIAQAVANLRLRETLKNQSIRDPLTNLFNRRYMEESLEREVSRAERNHNSIGIIMIDVDHFKKFNDTFGHEAGDVVLRELGTFFPEHIRGSDIACRYGGEEFTLILPGASLEVTQQRAHLLREQVKYMNLQYRQQQIGPISLSLGVASWPIHGTSGVSVLQAADAALYRAKTEGRDRAVTATVQTSKSPQS